MRILTTEKAIHAIEFFHGSNFKLAPIGDSPFSSKERASSYIENEYTPRDGESIDLVFPLFENSSGFQCESMSIFFCNQDGWILEDMGMGGIRLQDQDLTRLVERLEKEYASIYKIVPFNKG
ncbi:hypothetical protein [Vibrio crassostreae]|uniref:hypothetical protein n=1 Tax=Vibrio crassostreae TaxID=246167 RepID=UPI001B305C7A|nr:hypothetical protein [Vibrio crassostreae]